MSAREGQRHSESYLNSKLPLGEVSLPLRRLQQLLSALVFGQASPNGASLLWSEVEGLVLLALVEQAQLRSLVGVDDCEDSGDRLSDIVAAREKSC